MNVGLPLSTWQAPKNGRLCEGQRLQALRAAVTVLGGVALMVVPRLYPPAPP